MKEFEPILERYADEGYAMYSKTVSPDKWGDVKPAKEYLRKYWLPESEYENAWKETKESIFVTRQSALSEPVFRSSFQVITKLGGCLFVEEEFHRFQDCFKVIDEPYLIIVESGIGGDPETPLFRLKYPSDITWHEFTSGGYISSILIEMPHNEYYVFGRLGEWGKYSGNDHPYPVDIIGFKTSHALVFTRLFGDGDTAASLPRL